MPLPSDSLAGPPPSGPSPSGPSSSDTPPSGVSLSGDKIFELAEIFHLMGDANRLRIILACWQGGPSVGDIAARLDLSPSLVSHHLRLLRAARILKGERRGKQVFYRLADDHVRRTVADMVAHVGEAQEEGQ